MTQSVWSRYHAWNQALAELIFTEDLAGRPVYLDMDDRILDEVGRRLEHRPDQPKQELVGVVRRTLHVDDGFGSVFCEHTDRLKAWRRQARMKTQQGHDVPLTPVVALLAVLTLAAEEMGADSDYAAHAYYPRLCRLLQVDDPAGKARLQASYQHNAEFLWRGLSEWLTRLEGSRGLPSAYALSHRYVGLPLSQALVRGTDRRRLPQMFVKFGLPPGADVSPVDLEALMDAWIQQTPSPVTGSLRSLWLRGKAKERIAEVAALELANWDGSADEEDERENGTPRRVSLLARLRRFPKSRLELSFVADTRAAIPPKELVAVSAAGRPTLVMAPAVGGRVQPSLSAEIDPASLLGGLLHLRDPETGLEARRPPRRVVPLRLDELLNAYVETERVQLGEDSVLLMKDDAGLRREVTDTLRSIARPGFQEQTDLPGLPDGWVLVTDVQVMAAPSQEPQRTDLQALVPILSTQLTLAGGMKLPGRVRKWSRLDPPEVRAVVQEAESIRVALCALTEDGLVEVNCWQADGPSLVAELAPLKLEDGDYELTLLRGNRAVQQTTLRLRSSSTPDRFTPVTAPSLVHPVPGDPLAVLGGRDADEGVEDAVEGAYSPPCDQDPTLAPARRTITWNGPKPAPGVPIQQSVVIAPPDPKSCVATGAHYMELPPFLGKARGAQVTGHCRDCGIVKRYPAWYSPHQTRAWTRREAAAAPLRLTAESLPPVDTTQPTWDIGLDSLVHTGGGQFGWLERVALQVEGSSLFVDDFTRGLEALGHLEIARGDDLKPTQWAVAPRYLAGLVSGEYLVTGAWSGAERGRLRRLTERAGGRLVGQRQPDGPTRWVVEGLDEDAVDAVAEEADAGVAFDATRDMLRVLPPLSAVEQGLSRAPMPGARRITRFHLPSASWQPVTFATEPGAYRLEASFTTSDVYRSQDDVERGLAARSTVQLSKHLAALAAGMPLVAYSAVDQRLAVPLGADLPGLYGRAVVLCSGRLPTRLPEQRALVYDDVPADVADVLTGLLTS